MKAFRRLLAIGLASALSVVAFAQPNCITIPAGEFRLVPCPFTVSYPYPPFLSMLSWDGSVFNEDIITPAGWDLPPLVRGTSVILHPVGGPATICFPEPTQSPTLPLRLACGFNAVGCQSNIVAGFEDIVGRPPWEGVQVYRLNPGPGRQPANFAPPDYTIYTFSAGSWSPTVPIAQVFEGVFVYQPLPKLWNLQVLSGLVRFDVTAPPGRTVILEYVDQFNAGGEPVVWNELTRFSGTGAFQPVTDETGTGASSKRFYRARLE